MQIPCDLNCTDMVLVKLTGQVDLVKLPSPTLDKVLTLADFDFRFSTLSWV
jgi:hypothetical protein